MSPVGQRTGQYVKLALLGILGAAPWLFVGLYAVPQLDKVKIPKQWAKNIPVLYHIWWIHSPVVLWVAVGVASGLFVSSWPHLHNLQVTQRQPWLQREQDAELWQGRWMACKVPIPAFMMYRKLNGVSDSLFTIALFQTASGTPIETYEKVQDRLGTMIGSALYISPIMTGDSTQDKSRAASSHHSVFEVGFAKGSNPHALLLHKDPVVRMLILKILVRKAFADIKLSSPQMQGSVTEITPTDAPGKLFWSEWAVPLDVAASTLADKSNTLQRALGVEWLGVDIRPGSRVFGLLYGRDPRHIDVGKLPEAYREIVERVQWAKYLRIAKIIDGRGYTPKLLRTFDNLPGGLLSAQFEPLEGVPVETLRQSAAALVPTMQRNYVEIEPLPPAKDITPGSFQVIYGDNDPLNSTYLFKDFAKEVMTPKAPVGQPDVTFIVGVGADGRLIRFDHDTELAHIVIGGGSGAGKSTLLHSIILQLAFKHSPKDLVLYMADPKNELNRYKTLPHLKRIVDMNSITASGSNSPYANFAEMMKELTDEMDKRNETFQRLPGHPQKLSQARMISAEVRNQFPYVECIVDECADYFVPPTRKADRADYDEAIFYAELLARKARSAGIYMILATQRPSKQSIPMVIKGMASRIGLMTSSLTDSQIIIDQPGLQDIKVRGRGLISSEYGYRGFRALLLRKPDEMHTDWPDELAAMLTLVGVVERDGVLKLDQGEYDVPDPDLVWADNTGS